MKIEDAMLKKIVLTLVLLAVGLFSFLFIADKTRAPQTYTELSSSIDDKISTVLRLTAASTIASAGVSAIPGDTATPIADKLADFSGYFLIVLCALYTEKYLMSIIGLAVFRILIPAACLLGIVRVFTGRVTLTQIAVKLALFGLALYVAIPLSIRASDLINETYRTSIEQTINDAEGISGEAEGLQREEEESGLSGLISRLTGKANELSEKAANILNRFIEVLAVMLVTSCLIPILVLVFFAWLVKMFLGIDVPAMGQRFMHRPHKTEKREE